MHTNTQTHTHLLVVLRKCVATESRSYTGACPSAIWSIYAQNAARARRKSATCMRLAISMHARFRRELYLLSILLNVTQSNCDMLLVRVRVCVVCVIRAHIVRKFILILCYVRERAINSACTRKNYAICFSRYAVSVYEDIMHVCLCVWVSGVG